MAIAACGSDDGGDASQDDQDQITAAVEASAVSGDPGACVTAQTQAFTEQSTGETGEAAIAQCEDEAGESAADSVAVENIEVDGDSATADVVGTGKLLDGQTIAVDLAKEDGTWKLDKLVEFTDFDRDAYIAAIGDAAGEGDPDIATCITESLASVSDEDLQNTLIESDDSIFDGAAACFGGPAQ
jgi:hypothetical protein